MERDFAAYLFTLFCPLFTSGASFSIAHEYSVRKVNRHRASVAVPGWCKELPPLSSVAERFSTIFNTQVWMAYPDTIILLMQPLAARPPPHPLRTTDELVTGWVNLSCPPMGNSGRPDLTSMWHVAHTFALRTTFSIILALPPRHVLTAAFSRGVKPGEIAATLKCTQLHHHSVSPLQYISSAV